MGSEDFRKVTRDEFREFLGAYTPELEHHCTTICDPPHHGYYDFSKAKSEIGTAEAAYEAKQAYCIYGDERGGQDEFYVRVYGE